MTDDGQPELDAETLAFAARVFDLARHGAADDLAALLDQGLPIDLRNDKGDTLLMLAAYNGNEAVARLLLARGADADAVNDRGQVPLAGVAFKGDYPIAVALLDHGAAVDGRGDRTPLMVAAMFDRTDLAALFLDRGADPTRHDNGGLDLWALCDKMGATKVPALIAERQQTDAPAG